MLVFPFHLHRSSLGVCARLGLLAGLLAFSLGAEAQLNDTGVTATDGGAPAGQDPQFGRDAAAGAGVLPKMGSGAKGFDFTKICNSGEAAGTGSCPADPTLGAGMNDWACTHDNVTGRTWEVKTVAGLRSSSHGYSWYDTNPATNDGNAGTQTPESNPGVCGSMLTNCNTEEYVAAVNALNPALCGFNNWRMPTREELRSIVDYGVASPTIDTAFFPNTPGSFFWSASASEFARDSVRAGRVNFHNGDDDVGLKFNARQVRLVRGGQ